MCACVPQDYLLCSIACTTWQTEHDRQLTCSVINMQSALQPIHCGTSGLLHLAWMLHLGCNVLYKELLTTVQAHKHVFPTLNVCGNVERVGVACLNAEGVGGTPVDVQDRRLNAIQPVRYAPAGRVRVVAAKQWEREDKHSSKHSHRKGTSSCGGSPVCSSALLKCRLGKATACVRRDVLHQFPIC
jgi:hypothetical protein